jgi:hypothetical protein
MECRSKPARLGSIFTAGIDAQAEKAAAGHEGGVSRVRDRDSRIELICPASTNAKLDVHDLR